PTTHHRHPHAFPTRRSSDLPRSNTGQDHADKAAALLTKAVAMQPDFAEAWSDLGQARKALLDDAGAFLAFRKSVELSPGNAVSRSEEHTSELQSLRHLVCRL